MTTALWVVGYCVFMWVLAFLLAVFTKWLDGTGLMIRLYAPLWPYMMFVGLVESGYEKMKRAKLQMASRWIVKELRARGIHVSGAYGRRRYYSGDWFNSCGEMFGRCQVFATVPPGYEDVYGTVYARAIKRFAYWGITATMLCREAEPPDPLDEFWAERHGFREYFAREYWVPCEDCGVSELYHQHKWGDTPSHERRWREHNGYYYKDKSRAPRYVKGHLCKQCSRNPEFSGAGWGNALYKA